jgi:hypothetical protein
VEDFQQICERIQGFLDELEDANIAKGCTKAPKMRKFMRIQGALLARARSLDCVIRGTLQINTGTTALRVSRQSFKKARNVRRISLLFLFYIPATVSINVIFRNAY